MRHVCAKHSSGEKRDPELQPRFVIKQRWNGGIFVLRPGILSLQCAVVAVEDPKSKKKDSAEKYDQARRIDSASLLMTSLAGMAFTLPISLCREVSVIIRGRAIHHSLRLL